MNHRINSPKTGFTLIDPVEKRKDSFPSFKKVIARAVHNYAMNLLALMAFLLFMIALIFGFSHLVGSLLDCLIAGFAASAVCILMKVLKSQDFSKMAGLIKDTIEGIKKSMHATVVQNSHPWHRKAECVELDTFPKTQSERLY